MTNNKKESFKKLSVFVLCFALVAVFAAVLAINTAKAESGLQISRDLTVGSIGEDVRSLQKYLNSIGYKVALAGPGSPGSETARFGFATKAALMNYQAANGLPATGYCGSQTRALLSGGESNAVLLAKIQDLQKQIAALQALLDSMGDETAPSISSIKVADGGDEDYIDEGDYISITFSEAIDPESVNDDLDEGETVTGVAYSEVGGVSLSSAGKVTIKGIASFDMGSVEDSENFKSKLALSSTGKILTITITGGDDVKIKSEDFSSAAQIGGSIEDKDGNEMKSDSSIDEPTGTFGGEKGDDDDDDDDNDGDGPEISAIKVSDGGDEGYIDIGDSIAITFSEAIDPESVNDDLDEGETVSSISSTKTGGVSVSSGGTVTIKDIATFDMGSVENEGKFTSKIALNSTGKILTVTLTSGSDIDITDEDFDNATQSGGTIEDKDGNEMEYDSNIDDPSGTFGGDENGDDDDEEGPYISSIKVSDGGDEDQVDVGDYLTITFSEAIDPESVNDDLDEGETVEDVDYWSVGGVSVSSAGKVTVEGIASFSMGEVDESGDFDVKLSLNSTGKILTVTLFDGDDIGIEDEDFDDGQQIGGIVEDLDGDEMESDSSISDPTGTFGGGSSSNDGPYISTIKISDGGEEGYIDTKDSIAITFSEAIDPESVNDDLDEGETVTGVAYSETGGVSVSSSGKVTIKGIASFDMGSVEDSGKFTSKLALSSTGKILTITLTSGSDIEITDEDFGDAAQIGGTVEDQDGDEMESDSSISDPTGTFGGDD
ncbi:MAG TPA: peptidoglycan-binding protein [Candidatus Paceibacterota bacterium]|nr:peptidoglycan-binding protein [Candidatus Paceibacterota bacterium]HSA37091.1 peptidoglycan-binding protein [Candidatus Paceibacterota bacterium]